MFSKIFKKKKVKAVETVEEKKEFSKHKFIPIDRFYKNFPNIYIDKGNSRKSLVGFKLLPDKHSISNIKQYQGEDFTRIGYGQYVIKKMSKDIVENFMFRNKEDKVETIPFDDKLENIGCSKEFSELKKYKKIKAVFSLYDWNDNLLDCEPIAMPSGKKNCHLIGFLVK